MVHVNEKSHPKGLDGHEALWIVPNKAEIGQSEGREASSPRPVGLYGVQFTISNW